MTKKVQPFALTAAEIAVFEAQDFARKAPGTVLADFETLLTIIGQQGMPSTPTQLLPLGSLAAINRSLSHPIDLPLARPRQKSYPHIDGLYLLLRATGLVCITAVNRKPFLKLDPNRLSVWQSLNPTERYFALLEAWWARGTADILGERGGWTTSFQMRSRYLLEELLEAGRLVYRGPKEADTLRYYPGFYTVALLQLFGLIAVSVLPPGPGKGWLPERIEITEWGRALTGSYLRQQKTAYGRETEPEGEGFLDSFVTLESVLAFRGWSHAIRPYFPEWCKDLDSCESELRPGPLVFKVSLGRDCWRRIAIPGKSELEEFANAILHAFNFDNDHLYCFRYKDRFGRNAAIDDPRVTEVENPPADRVRIGDLPLIEGTRFTFLFDFGDHWEFGIDTESVHAERVVTKPKVLEKHGKAPQQYG